MADKHPPEPDPSSGDRSKLPPRSGDWQSGLKRDNPEKHKVTASDTVSDFLASHGPDPDEDIIFPEDEPGVTITKPVGESQTIRDLEFYGRRTHFSDLLIALLLAIVAFAAVALSYKGFGHSWDEALYLKPAERAAAWMMGVFNSGDDSMLQHEAVDRHWGRELDGQDPLHPEVAPVPKLLDGAGLTYLAKVGYGPMVAMRLPAAVLFGLTVAFLFLLGTREYGRVGGFAAAFIYMLMPRVFGHAHIAASETPLAFFIVLTVWCFLIANRFWPFALFTGIAFGLAVAAKVTALLLPVPLIIWGQFYKRRDYASNIFAMIFVAPIALLAVWPWLWYDGLRRFFEYLLYYTRHQQTAVYYMGQIWGYGRPSAPFYYPLHMTALVLPIWILVFLALGLLRALFSTIRRPVTVLYVLLALSWLGLSMLPNAPRYDGERLFFPAFAFLALLAGGGFSMIFSGVRRWRHRRDPAGPGREAGYVATIALLACAVYGAADIYFSHPNELNYYNWLVGRPKGAEQQGFETAYWGEGVNEDVTAYLSQTLKPGDKVKTLALNELAFENLRQWGKLPDKVDFDPDVPPYDYVVMQVRQGFMGPLERRLLRSRKPVKSFEAQGVPRILVFDGKALADIFPPEAGNVSTSSTEAVTSPTTQLSLETLPTSPSKMLPSLVPETTATAAMNELTTGTNTTSGSLDTTTVMVLDLPTSTAETTATEDRLSPVAVDLLTLPGSAETSAPGTYQGNLPGTTTLPIIQP